jgi:hypothetical protein
MCFYVIAMLGTQPRLAGAVKVIGNPNDEDAVSRVKGIARHMADRVEQMGYGGRVTTVLPSMDIPSMKRCA